MCAKISKSTEVKPHTTLLMGGGGQNKEDSYPTRKAQRKTPCANAHALTHTRNQHSNKLFQNRLEDIIK